MLDQLLDMPKRTVDRRLRCLHSVLDVPAPTRQESPIQLLHPTFRDFLVDKNRCEDPQFRVDEKEIHKDLFVNSLRLIGGLKRGMRNLRLPGAVNNDVESNVKDICIPLAVQYACRFWANHLQQSGIQLCGNEQVQRFLMKDFLHWLEVLSLIGRISDGVLLVKTLESMLTVSTFIFILHQHQKTCEFWKCTPTPLSR